MSTARPCPTRIVWETTVWRMAAPGRRVTRLTVRPIVCSWHTRTQPGIHLGSAMCRKAAVDPSPAFILYARVYLIRDRLAEGPRERARCDPELARQSFNRRASGSDFDARAFDLFRT